MLTLIESNDHECENFLSGCCGAEEFSDVRNMCKESHEWAAFECTECGELRSWYDD